MRFLFVLVFVIGIQSSQGFFAQMCNSAKMHTPNSMNRFKLHFCESNVECDLPMICCNGFFYNYCCFGGLPVRIPRALFPNSTKPNLIPASN